MKILNKCQYHSCFNFTKRKFCGLKCSQKFSGEQRRAKKLYLYSKNPSFCKSCNQEMPYDLYRKKNIFCNSSCSAKFNNQRLSKEQKIKKNKNISNQLKLVKKNTFVIGPFSKVYLRTCQNTGLKFYSKSSKSRLHPSEYTKFEHYRQLCKFNLKITDYPEWFANDIKLLKKHGWYQPTNRGNNLFGVSKDHIISVFYGFQNNIDPKIISHPANLQIILQKDNSSKNIKCDITIDELLSRIIDFERKY